MFGIFAKAASDAIKRASSKNTTSSNNTVKVGSSGNADKGLGVGTVVNTGGGDYKIVDKNTTGANYNPTSGYYSIKLDPNTSSNVSNNITTTSNKTSNTSKSTGSSKDYRDTSNDFNSKYDAQIRGIAEANGVDMSVGREMFTSNLEGGLQGVQFDPYKGGGVATNWDEMVNDWSNLKNAAITSTNQEGRTVTNSYGREVNTSDLLPTGSGYGTTTGSSDPKLDAIIRGQGGVNNTITDTYPTAQQYNQQPYIINQGYNVNDVNNMMGQMGQQVGNMLSNYNNNLSQAIMNMGQSFGSSLDSLASTLGGLSFATKGINGEDVYKTGKGSYLATFNGKAIELSEDDYVKWMIELNGF